MIRFLFSHRTLLLRPNLLVLLVGAALGGLAGAESPDSPVRCILLRNGNVLEGVPVQEGGSITISIGEHQSLRLPSNQVLCWADDRYQLYRYRLEHRTKSDLLTHLEAARWCIRENLFDPASAELQAARAIDAQHPSVAQVQATLRAARQRAEQRRKPVDATQPEQQADADQKIDNKTPTDPSDVKPKENSSVTLARLSRSTIGEYASRIQPILINRCGQSGCHGGQVARKASWKLTLPPSRQQRRLSTEMTRENLRELIAWIEINASHSSPLLKKAATLHGEMEDPPLGAADDDVLSELENWIASVAGELRDDESNRPAEIANLPTSAQTVSTAPSYEATREADSSVNGANSQKPLRPKRLPPVTNPFDPQVFNRLHHREPAGGKPSLP